MLSRVHCICSRTYIVYVVLNICVVTVGLHLKQTCFGQPGRSVINTVRRVCETKYSTIYKRLVVRNIHSIGCAAGSE